MKRAILAVLAVVVGYLEFRDDLEVWLPSWGSVYGGQVIGQVVILSVLAAIIFGSVVFLSYRFLNWIFE
ncbi:MAG: hypothetical protein ABSF93_00390 [Candidatus Sulfotelmatobacter sp.]|jgi:hypothetical protein